MPSLYQSECHIAIQAVITAARLCRNVQSVIDGALLSKDDRSPVTVADFASQAIVCRQLEKHFPNDPMIAEEDSAALEEPENAHLLDRIQHELAVVNIEAEAKKIRDWIDRGNTQTYSRRFWTLDPIDGTKGFLRGEQYAIALALIVDGKVEVAVLGCPHLSHPSAQKNSTGTLFCAVRGEGTSSFPFDAEAVPQPVSVSKNGAASAARLCESVESGHSSHNHSAHVAQLLGITSEPVRLDSQAKYATIASGVADIYLRLPIRKEYQEKIWDHAAGMLIVEEAGGKVTDITGKPLDFTQGDTLAKNHGVVATNGLLHKKVIAALNQNFEGALNAQ